MRIVSLTCSNTEIVCALGCGEQLVGVDDYSDHPPDVVSRLPRLGPDLGVDVERVKELAPDLVLASLTVPGHERVVDELGRAGLPFIAPAPVSLGDVYRDIRDIAARLRVEERGERLVERMRSVIPAEGTASGSGRVRRILVEWWPKPVIVPGGQSWVTDLLAAAGGENPFGGRAEKSLPIGPEEARAANPDAVVISWCGVDPAKYRPEKVYEREGWRGIRAITEGRVICVPEAYLGRPGPRLVEGYRELCRIVQECG